MTSGDDSANVLAKDTRLDRYRKANALTHFESIQVLSMSSQEVSYIDYEIFLNPEFSPSTFANSAILATNNPSDNTLDLNTPLSKTLFDLQEVDTHIHNVTTQSALPLLNYSQSKNEAASRLTASLEGQIISLTRNYHRLAGEVVDRHAAAEQVRLCAARLWVTLRIGRAVSRALALGRRLDSQMTEVRPSLTPGSGTRRVDDHHAMLAATHTLIALKGLFAADSLGMEGEHLGRIAAIGILRRDLVEPSESRLRGKAQQTIREFSLQTIALSSTTAETGQRESRSPSPVKGTQTTVQSYSQTAETKSRTTAALLTLFLLSPVTHSARSDHFSPVLLLTSLQTYLTTSLTSSAASLSRALAQLPQLPRALQEVTARCQNIVALENLLRNTLLPVHPLLEQTEALSNRKKDEQSKNPVGSIVNDRIVSTEEPDGRDDELRSNNMLGLLLNTLDTASLPSYFWRSLASSMGSKVSDIITRSGAPARSLRSQKDRVRELIRESVLRGSEGAQQPDGRSSNATWEREATVMIASILGPIGR